MENKREYLDQYNVTKEDKYVWLKAKKNNSELEDRIRLLLKADGFYPFHVDILNKTFQKMNNPLDDRVYLIQDLNYLDQDDIEQMPDYSLQDIAIERAISILNHPKIKPYLIEFYKIKESQS